MGGGGRRRWIPPETAESEASAPPSNGRCHPKLASPKLTSALVDSLISPNIHHILPLPTILILLRPHFPGNCLKKSINPSAGVTSTPF